MGRREVVGLGFLLSLAYVGVGAYLLRTDVRMAAGVIAIGLYGIAILVRYRRQIVAG
jgi:hypothetical protein